jgi:tetratricopeptide (TPR) repeat protein
MSYRWITQVALIACGAIGLYSSARAELATDEAADYENRIEFGYLSEDANALRALERSLTGLAADHDGDPALHYLAAHTAYRLAQVLDATHKAGAEDAAKRCVEFVAGFTRRDSKDVEAFAQKAACHGLLAGIGVVKAVTHGPQAADAVEAALELAPKNPRAHLADALVDYWRPGRLGGDRARAFRKFKTATELFEAVPAGASEFPSWGSADAYFWLGRCYVEQGDVAAARSALEKALIVAPDFAAARRQLAKLSTHG